MLFCIHAQMFYKSEFIGSDGFLLRHPLAFCSFDSSLLFADVLNLEGR